MTTVTGAPVVAGVDGSASALSAVRLAAAEAVRRHRPLRVVHAFVWPMLGVPLDPPPGGPPGSGLRHEAERVVATAVAEARAAAPGLPVEGVVTDGQPAAVLIAEATHAALVVIGDRGLGGFTGLLVGSVAVQSASYAACPILVARGVQRASGPVVVGVDGSPQCEQAIGYAVETAALRKTHLVAVHTYRHPVSTGAGDMLPLVYDREELRGEEERVLAEAVAGWEARYPEVPIACRLVRGRAAATLVEESTDAQLVVVGSRGRGGFVGLMTGSVSQAVLHHAHCPVAVVRSDAG